MHINGIFYVPESETKDFHLVRVGPKRARTSLQSKSILSGGG